MLLAGDNMHLLFSAEMCIISAINKKLSQTGIRKEVDLFVTILNGPFFQQRLHMAGLLSFKSLHLIEGRMWGARAAFKKHHLQVQNWPDIRPNCQAVILCFHLWNRFKGMARAKQQSSACTSKRQTVFSI